MKLIWIVIAILTTGIRLPARGNRSADQGTPLSVCLDDSLPNRLEILTVDEAETLASRILGGAGVSPVWQTARACRKQPIGPIVIDIVENAPAAAGPNTIARAFYLEGVHIQVFANRMSYSPHDIDPVVLGHVLVHEITHILQGIDRHSATGIMKATWEASDYSLMHLHPLGFTPQDIELIRLGLLRRASRAPLHKEPNGATNAQLALLRRIANQVQKSAFASPARCAERTNWLCLVKRPAPESPRRYDARRDQSMKKFLITLVALAAAAGNCAAQEYKIAIVGLVHSHVWGHLANILKSQEVKLVGVAEPNPALVAEAEKAGVDKSLFATDYLAMLEKTKPDIVWAFVENNRHLEIVKICAPRKINVIFEKPLASSGPDAREIRKLALQSGIRVMTNYQMAWWPANYLAKKTAESELGQIYRLHGIVGHGGPGSQGPRNQYFFAWLTDPVKNGAGALMDFGCYNALWSLWYMGKPETVYAHANHIRPETFPKVEDNADMVLGYKKGAGIFEASWDLPRSYQDLEIYGLKGSVYMEQKGVTVQLSKDKEAHKLDLTPLPPEDAEPVSYMVSRLRHNKPIEGVTAVDINVSVIEIIDAAKQSIASGKAVKFGGM